jgi:hypothetical protein
MTVLQKLTANELPIKNGVLPKTSDTERSCKKYVPSDKKLPLASLSVKCYLLEGTRIAGHFSK